MTDTQFLNSLLVIVPCVVVAYIYMPRLAIALTPELLLAMADIDAYLRGGNYGLIVITPFLRVVSLLFFFVTLISWWFFWDLVDGKIGELSKTFRELYGRNPTEQEIKEFKLPDDWQKKVRFRKREWMFYKILIWYHCAFAVSCLIEIAIMNQPPIGSFFTWPLTPFFAFGHLLHYLHIW